jgi:hypothetical protein
MTEIANGNVEVPPPHAQLIQMGMGFIPARVLYLAAKLGSADLLADEPKSAAELAGPTGVHQRALHRLMRTLSSLGVLAEGPGGRFGVEFALPSGHTPHPGKILDMVMLTVAGGEERTEEEYATLLAEAGLRMTRVVPTASAASIVEAVLA